MIFKFRIRVEANTIMIEVELLLNCFWSAGSWRPTVPSWEKEFCSSVGLVSWTKLLEAKRFMHLHNNIVKWNDSAGEEAFSNAKMRFYAKINRLPCDISLPDPNKYIDEIDWDSAIDPSLLSDLEHEQSKDVEDGAGSVIFGSVLLNQSFGCIGWGDAEEAFEVSKNFCPVPEFGNSYLNADGTKNSWYNYPPHRNNPNKANGWGNYWNNNYWNENCRDDCDWNNGQYRSGNAEDWKGTWGWNNQHKRKVADGHFSRHKISRFHGNESQIHRGGGNGQGMRRDNLAYRHSSWMQTH